MTRWLLTGKPADAFPPDPAEPLPVLATGLPPLARRPLLRGLAWSYPALMLLVIVATGNHFFFDAAAGALAIGVGYLSASWVDSATRVPRRRPAEGSVAATS